MPIRSNHSIAEERNRFIAAIQGKQLPSCQQEDCDNFGSPVTELGLYARFGKTKAGTPRWRCNACRKTFAEDGAPLLRQRKAHKNRDVFMLLVNKAPMRRIVEVTGLDPKSLYGKLDFIFHQRVKTTGFQPVSFSCENEEAGGVRWTTDTAVTRYFRSSITLCG